MADVEYIAKDGSTEIKTLFPESEIQVVRFMLGNAMVELHNNQLRNGLKTVDVHIRQNQEFRSASSVNVVSTMVDEEAPPNEITSTVVNMESPAQPGNEIDQELVKKEAKKKELREIEEKRKKHREKLHGWLLVVVSVYIAMTYQAGMSPPGGLWQDDSSSLNTTMYATQMSSSNNTNIPSNETNIYPHDAGDSILNDKHPTRFYAFYYVNSFAFSISLITILMLLSETFTTINWYMIRAIKYMIIFATILVGAAFTVGSARNGQNTNSLAICFICWYVPFIAYDMYILKKLLRELKQENKSGK